MAARLSSPLAAVSEPCFLLHHSILRLAAAAAAWRVPAACVTVAKQQQQQQHQGRSVWKSALRVVSQNVGEDALDAELRRGDGEVFTDAAAAAVDSDCEDDQGDALTAASTVDSSPKGSVLVVPGRTFGRLKINLDILLYRAKCCRRIGRSQEAESILRECIRDWPDDGRAYVALGTSLVRSGKVKEAAQLYEDGCQAARGENPYIWQAWAVLEERNGNISKARSLFDAATAADQTHAAAWHGWAVLELRYGTLKKARTLLFRGLQNCGDNEYLYQTLAMLEVRTGNIEQARTYFVKATKANPRSAASWLAWALMEVDFGVKKGVRQLFQKGLQAVPKNRYIWQAWARFEAKEGNSDRARYLFQRGIELNPNDVVLLQAYALFEYDCGQLDLSRSIFKHGVTVDAKHQPLWLAWGWVEWKESNAELARELYQRSLVISNRNMNAVRTYQAWGVLESKESNFGAARALFRSALRLDSQNMPAWLSWAAMEERCGNAVRAEELRTQCLQQKTEVVESSSWDVNLSQLLGPTIATIDGISGLLNSEQRYKKKDTSEEEGRSVRQFESFEFGDAESNRWGSGDNFDIEKFLQDKFPWKYRKSASSTRLQQARMRNTQSSLVKLGR